MCTPQAKSFRPHDEDDDDSDDDYSDDEELQSPIDEVDPFIFFVDTIKGKGNLFCYHTEKNNLRLISFCHLTSYFCCFGSLESAMQASDPLRFQNLTQTLDFHFQALANGVAEHAEQRRVVIEKEKLEKASTAGAS